MKLKDIFSKDRSQEIEYYEGSTQKWLPVKEFKDGVIVMKDCRLVLLVNDVIAGWTALHRVDPRWCYRGVAEVSIYVGEQFRGHGLGCHLLAELCRQAEEAGYWTLQSTVLQDNAASRALHTKCGFRLVGRRERIARDCHGRWLDTFLMERRAAADEPEGYKKL